MNFTDIPSLLFVGLPAVFAGLSARFGPESWARISAIILPIGISGTSIGMVHMLRQMDDPDQFLPSLFVASLCIFYAFIVKLSIDGALRGQEQPIPSQPAPLNARTAVILLVVVIAAAMSMDGLISFVDVRAALIILCAMAVTKWLPGAFQEVGFLPAAMRVIPIVGIAALLISNALMWLNMDDPTRIGPLMAQGLLAHLYANLFVATSILYAPHRAQRNSNGVQWTFCLLGMLGMYGSFVPIILYFT